MAVAVTGVSVSDRSSIHSSPDVESNKSAVTSRKSADSQLFLGPSVYRYLFSVVFLVNLALFIYLVTCHRSLVRFVDAAAANFLACGLARQPLVVNGCFQILCSIPRSLPLRVRHAAANIYHYGGVHSGCGITALLWYIGVVALLTRQYMTVPASTAPATTSTVALVIAYLILILIVAIVAVAYPTFRVRHHDAFESTHRYFSWLVVALFLTLLIVFAHSPSSLSPAGPGSFLLQLPAFWCVLAAAVAIIHPWTRLRRLDVEPEYLSSHAVRLHLKGATRFGKTISLAAHPLQDWHSFATFPDEHRTDETDRQTGCSVLVSRAGDWTAACIQQPPTVLWTRGLMTYGFTRAMRLFRRVVVVATGSGIGPCLAFLEDKQCPALRLIWQARAPQRTYGARVMELVHRLDPTPVVIDTDKSGRADLRPWIEAEYGAFQAEAVCVISNRSFTHTLVAELKARGVRAFGPLFDS
ncbi:uncharacterized protein N7459_007022 [Penicillium hispanicum]|uniref:uncharacterized protein n=1 Tax=Penicillium hispanicum TaxID=1080232 RepID=UPI00253F9724|nr:uncharacterized protein N7459_007022 [Penicillium hispanicum]KAJ5578058.1 hypothetical protein N7459_007022 [Penicillium hispanicum]